MQADRPSRCLPKHVFGERMHALAASGAAGPAVPVKDKRIRHSVEWEDGGDTIEAVAARMGGA
jgi:hypothetical protein